MGCPVPKITNCEAGARWLLESDRIYDLITDVVAAVEKPPTVKMRISWDHDHAFAIENAKAIAVHGLTRKQLYEGTADWDIIRQVKQAVNIPVIGNGDIDSPEVAKNV